MVYRGRGDASARGYVGRNLMYRFLAGWRDRRWKTCLFCGLFGGRGLSLDLDVEDDVGGVQEQKRGLPLGDFWVTRF